MGNLARLGGRMQRSLAGEILMTMTIYMLKSCDSCKKAIKALQAAGHDPVLVDVRADGVPKDHLAGWLETHGADVMINRKSTTWRGLDDAERQADPLALLMANPTLMKRPVIVADGTSYVGWSKDVQAALGL
ncbi:MAG: ArsC/Spx/MgsR family protein [Alphaproteobacteria bacterium]